MERRPVSQRRYRLDLSEDEILEQEVEDALRATPEERMAAAVALLETVYQLWASRGLADGQGLCRVPGRTQQERRVLRGDRGDGGPGAYPLPDSPGEILGVPTSFASVDDLISMKRAAGRPEKDLPDLKRLEKLKASRLD